jgi:hypothetical protein
VKPQAEKLAEMAVESARVAAAAAKVLADIKAVAETKVSALSTRFSPPAHRSKHQLSVGLLQ